MLLTSAQVSVAVSSGIVILFTAALFLSGYVLQQRTLRDLRAAIKPKPEPSPRIFLPDRFNELSAELSDGVFGDDDAEQRADVEIEVRPTMPDQTANQRPISDQQQRAAAGGQYSSERSQTKEKAKTGQSRGQRVSRNRPSQQQPQKPIGRAERRRRIRDEIMSHGQGEDPGWYYQRKPRQ